MSAQRRQRQRAAKDISISEVITMMTGLPAEARAFFDALSVAVAVAGNKMQLSPEQMLCGLGVITASTLLCHVDPRDDPAIDRLIRYGGDAINAATALRRIQIGAVGPRADGTFGIKLDA